MSIIEQKANDIFWTMISTILGKGGRPLAQTYIYPPVYKSIFNFETDSINNSMCNQADSTFGFGGKTCHPIKRELVQSINVPGIEASVQPDDISNVNTNYLTEGDTINLLNARSKIFLPLEITQNLFESKTRRQIASIDDIPYCIVYGTLKGQSNTEVVHVSAAIIYNKRIYPFGYTNAQVMSDPTAIPITPVQAVLVSPETPELQYTYFILDIQILTTSIINRLKRYLSGTLKSTIEVSKRYARHNTYGLMFSENYLYLGTGRKYFRFRNMFSTITDSCVDVQNCASFMEYIFGIDCQYFTFSLPGSCKRKSKSFTILELGNINRAIRENNVDQFILYLTYTENGPTTVSSSKKRNGGEQLYPSQQNKTRKR